MSYGSYKLGQFLTKKRFLLVKFLPVKRYFFLLKFHISCTIGMLICLHVHENCGNVHAVACTGTSILVLLVVIEKV